MAKPFSRHWKTMEVVSRTEGAKRMPDVKQVADGAKTIACEGDTEAGIVFPFHPPNAFCVLKEFA
jgi:hypothetical protein